ncbi:putative F-box associated domain, type 1 [Arabidopsis thaliana]
MTTISDLPKELVEEIISGVPTKLMRAVRGDNTRLVVWNPYIGQTRSIKLVKGWDTCSYAFGCLEKKKKSCRSHKILRFLDDDTLYNGRDNFRFKFLKVNTGPEVSLVFESFIIDEEKKVVMVSEGFKHRISYILGENGYLLRELDLGESIYTNCWTQACSYVPSLV